MLRGRLRVEITVVRSLVAGLGLFTMPRGAALSCVLLSAAFRWFVFRALRVVFNTDAAGFKDTETFILRVSARVHLMIQLSVRAPTGLVTEILLSLFRVTKRI